MKKERNNNVIIITALGLLLVLGLLLGASITTFVLFLSSHNDLLAILSYLCLIVFVLVLIVDMYIFVNFRHQIFVSKNNKKKELENENE